MDNKLPKQLVVAFFDEEEDVDISEINWSGRFKIDTVGEFQVKLLHP